MSILDKVKVGNSVQVNLESSKDRLTKEIVDAINVSSVCKILDFRITDGKGIGVILQLSNGKSNGFLKMKLIFWMKMVIYWKKLMTMKRIIILHLIF